jgi:hypothetical protein
MASVRISVRLDTDTERQLRERARAGTFSSRNL